MTSYYCTDETEYDYVNDEYYDSTFLVCEGAPTPEALELVMGLFYDPTPLCDGEPLFTAEEYREIVLESMYVTEDGRYVYEVTYD